MKTQEYKTKKCTECSATKSIEHFYKRSDSDGYKSSCKDCYKKRKPKKKHVAVKDMPNDLREFEIKTCKKCGFTGEKGKHFSRGNVRGTWQYGHCKKCTSENTRAWRYNITVEDMRILLDKATHCELCNREFKSNRKVIDHCHDKGHIRGILCDPCNTTLGQLEREKGLKEKFINYIKSN